jgi:hypothetical protein
MYGRHYVCAGADGEETGGGGAAGFVAVAEEAVEAAVVSFTLVLVVGGGGSHSVSPAFVMTFDIMIYVPDAGH